MTTRNAAFALVFLLVILGVCAIAWEYLHSHFPFAWTAGVVIFVLALAVPLALADTPPEEKI